MHDNLNETAAVATADPVNCSVQLKPKQRYEENRVRGYQLSWESKFDWVRCEENVMFCATCRQYPHLSDQASTLVKGIAGHKRCETLVSHEKSRAHIKCITQKSVGQRANKQGPLQKCVAVQKTKLTAEQQQTLSVLVNTAYYVGKRKMAFDSFASLCELQEKNGINVGQMYRHDKGCRDFVESIAYVEKDRIKQGVKAARFFAVMGDGSTDTSITEQEGFFIRYSIINTKKDQNNSQYSIQDKEQNCIIVKCYKTIKTMAD